MSVSRRSALKVLATGVGSAAATAALPASASAAPAVAREDMVGMLFDTTKCIGCQVCMVGCREANDLKFEDGDGLHYNPVSLNAGAKTVIKRYAEGKDDAFYKAQCLHCIDPACVNACMFGALQKRGVGGVVTWEGDKCTGCRYCQIGCPFNVPRFEFNSWNPKVVKCEMCNHLLEQGGVPKCVEVCPRDAIIYGKRDDLIREAHNRIAEKPEVYLDHVYGEKEAGGTQVLYLSHVPFEKLGLPTLSEESLPHRVNRIQGTLYKGMIAPVTLLAVLGAVINRNLKREAAEAAEAEARAAQEQEEAQ